MKSGGLILWNPIAICETSKTSWPMGIVRINDELENHSPHQTIGQEFINFGKKVLPANFLGYELIAEENLERRYSDSGHGRIE